MQQYMRIFMPLVNESTGYEYKGKAPSGRCLLESRSGTGKIMLWVQDLKPEVLYRVHLIFKNENNYAGLPLCSLSPSLYGKAELRHSFDAADIEGFNLSLEQCLAVAIIATGGNGISAPLCGYKQDIQSWRNGFIRLEKAKEAPKESIKETPEAIEAPADVPSEISEEVPLEEISLKETSFKEAPEDILKEVGKKDDEEILENALEDSEETLEDAADEAIITFNICPESTLSEAFKNEVETILKSHTHMQPFEKQNRDVDWVRISLNEDLSLPDGIRDLLNEPFVESAYRQYNHLILGKALDEGLKRYYIGIPALYDPKDKIIGFRQFKCSEDTEPMPGDYGYWLIFMS